MKIILLIHILLHGAAFAIDFPSFSSNSDDWKLESLNVTKADDDVEYLGGYHVVAEFRNVSEVPIKVAKNRVWSYVAPDQLADDELSKYMMERNRIHHACCHEPEYIEVGVNQTYIVRYRESSKFKGKKFTLSTQGVKKPFVCFGTYTLTLTKE